LAISIQDEEVAHKLPYGDNGWPRNIRQQKIGLFGRLERGIDVLFPNRLPVEPSIPANPAATQFP
jgi:hypothetical protein